MTHKGMLLVHALTTQILVFNYLLKFEYLWGGQNLRVGGGWLVFFQNCMH